MAEGDSVRPSGVACVGGENVGEGEDAGAVEGEFEDDAGRDKGCVGFGGRGGETDAEGC